MLLATLVSLVTYRQHGASCPAAPANFAVHPQSCIGQGGHCYKPLVVEHNCTATLAECVAIAFNNCTATQGCHSFAVLSDCNDAVSNEPTNVHGANWHWQTFEYGNASLDANQAWVSYTLPGGPQPPSPSPSPSPPPPQPDPPHPTKGGIRPPGAPVELDCAMRRFSLEYAQQLFPERNGFPEVADALQIERLNCTTTARSSSPSVSSTAAQQQTVSPQPHVAGGVPVAARATATTIFADAGTGSDTSGDGSQAHPFGTIEKAVAAAAAFSSLPSSRSAASPPGTVVLNGTFYLNATVELTAAHSGLTITSYSGQEAIISGGQELALEWKPVQEAKAAQGVAYPPGVYVAEIPASVTDFAQLYVDGRREVRARWPNGDPETQGQSENNQLLPLPASARNSTFSTIVNQSLRCFGPAASLQTRQIYQRESARGH